ncbi:MAG: nitroreductase family protein [Nitrospinae bacterium]|nr:nitroreductase family protein [Nitrospinota bacterium]
MIELLRQRRSIRKFKETTIENEKIKLLSEAAVRSPTSRNKKAWKFIFIQDKETIQKLALSKTKGTAFLNSSPLAVVVCGNEEETDVWVEDCSIASIILQLQAQSLGLSSCWGQIRKRKHNNTTASEEYVRSILKLPENFRIESIIGIGYPDEEKQGVPENELDYQKVEFR